MLSIIKRLLLISVLLFTVCEKENNDDGIELDTDQLIEDLRILSSDDMEGRATGTEGGEKARQYILQRIQEEGALPFKGSFTHPFTFSSSRTDKTNGVNVISTIEGQTDSVIVISAHYDHLGIKNGEIYNGADDNASGTAALFTLMDYFSRNKPKHTLVFAAFDAEEVGLKGAYAFVEDSVFLKSVTMNVNMDMVAQNAKSGLYACGTYHFPELKPILESIDTGDQTLLFGHDEPNNGQDDWSYASDHGAFLSKGKKFIYFGVEDHEYYHQPTDEFGTIPQDFYKGAVKLILNAVLALDKN